MHRLAANGIQAFEPSERVFPDATNPKILVIEGDEILLARLTEQLELDGFVVQAAKNRAQAKGLLRSLRFDAILGELTLPDGDCEQIYQEALPFTAATPAIFIVTPGEVDQAIRLVKMGAADCIQRPFEIRALIERLRGLVNRRQATRTPWPEPIVNSPAMQALAARLKRIAAMNVSLFIAGESGCGKEVVARHLHRISPRRHHPFIAVRCGSLAGADGDHVLFGQKTSDDAEHGVLHGALEQVGRGTLFLDEVEEMSSAAQSKLIHVIDSGWFSRVGEAGVHIPFEARIVSASDVPSGRLFDRVNPDLLHRLAVIEIDVPPLRERQADIEPIAEALLSDIALDLGVAPVPMDAEAVSALRTYNWPGNVRELRNRLTRALSFAKGAKIGVEDLFPDLRLTEQRETHEPTLEEMRASAERQHIAQSLALHNGRIGDTALSLGISRVTLWSKMKKLGMAQC